MKKITALLLVMMCALGAWAQSDRRWSIDAGGGYATTFNGSADMGIFNVGVQRYLCDFFSVGVGTGMYYCDGVIVPLYADMRGYYPFQTSRFSLIGIVRVGGGWGHYSDFGLEVLPGVRYKLTEKSHLRVNLGVGLYGNKTMGSVQIGYSHDL